eukprot:5962590-Prymnesium_polylepis.1
MIANTPGLARIRKLFATGADPRSPELTLVRRSQGLEKKDLLDLVKQAGVSSLGERQKLVNCIVKSRLSFCANAADEKPNKPKIVCLPGNVANARTFSVSIAPLLPKAEHLVHVLEGDEL